MVQRSEVNPQISAVGSDGKEKLPAVRQELRSKVLLMPGGIHLRNLLNGAASGGNAIQAIVSRRRKENDAFMVPGSAGIETGYRTVAQHHGGPALDIDLA